MGKTTLNPSHSTRLWAQLNYFYYILNHLPAHKPAHRLYPILLYHFFLICQLFQQISFQIPSNFSPSAAYFTFYTYTYTSPFIITQFFHFVKFLLIILFNYLLSFLLSSLPFYPASLPASPHLLYLSSSTFFLYHPNI